MYKKLTIMAIFVMFMFVGCGVSNNNINSTEDAQQEQVENSQKQEEEQLENEKQKIPVMEEKLVILYVQTNVNVRSTPSTNGEKLGKLSENQEVIAVGEAVDGWQKIRFQNGFGYVLSKYLSSTEVVSSNNQTQTMDPQKQMDEIAAEDLKLPVDFDPNGIVVVIDAGHQGKGNSEKEPDGPRIVYVESEG